MSRLYRNHVAAQQRVPEIIAEIERRFARPDYDTVRHFQNAYGIAWEDALHVEKLERQIDKLDAQRCRLSLSDTDRQRRVELELEQDRFIRAARCHAQKQKAKRQRSHRAPAHA